MPIDVHIDREAGIVRRTVTGSVGRDELIASFQEALNDPAFDPRMKSLMDFRAFEHQLGSDDMRGFADFFLARVEMVKDVRTAIVVSQTVSYGLARMLQTYLDASPITLEVFYDIDEAERWLQETGAGRPSAEG